MEKHEHKPVMLTPAVDAILIKPDGIYIDGTFGRGGHSREILNRLNDKGRLIGIDRDIEAVEYGKKHITDSRLTIVHSDFRMLDKTLLKLGITEKVNGILMDIGVSSPQLDSAQRGFSYMEDAPLDMRMDISSHLTAHEIVNHFDINEIKRILFEYGEERYGGRIAAAIDKKRKLKPIESTLELVDIIKSAMPSAALREKQHPAKRSFQALRIAVNDELNALSEAIAGAVDTLAPDGRIAIITFHSLEDRIVKNAFRHLENPCTCPKDLPICVCGSEAILSVITRKPILPSDREINENPRSRSAKLRVAKRVGVANVQGGKG